MNQNMMSQIMTTQSLCLGGPSGSKGARSSTSMMASSLNGRGGKQT